MQRVDPAIESLPKIHLHCHLEGTLAPATFLELTRRYGYSTRYRPGTELPGPRESETVYRFADFGEFLLLFAAVSRALASPDDYALLAREFVAGAITQNVVYGELFVSPSVWSFFHPALDVRAAMRAVLVELRAASQSGTAFELIVDLTRNFGPQSAMETARLAAEFAGEGVIGIGLGGDEARFPPALFRDAFAFARASGLHTVAHAGEAAGAASVRDAVELLGAQRIGHGIRALDDPAVIALLRERHILLEVCPTSNDLTGVVVRDQPHPFHALDAAGVDIAIDADDPALFGTSISWEYERVAREAGVPALERFIENAIEAAFLSPTAKQALRQNVKLERGAPFAKQ